MNESAFSKSWVHLEVFSQVAARSAKALVLESPGGLVKCSSLGPTPRASDSEGGLCSWEKRRAQASELGRSLSPTLRMALPGVHTASLGLSFFTGQIVITGLMTSCVSCELNQDTRST